MQTVNYRDLEFPVRDEFATSHTRYWQRLQSAGNWFTSGEKLEIAQAIRDARECNLCQRRKVALSPYVITGEHNTQSNLSAEIIEVIHAIVNDASRLTRQWYEGVLAAGMTDAEYVEIVGTVVAIVSIDSFADAMGIPLRQFPNAAPGDPSRYRPATATVTDSAWVPMVPADNAGTPESDLWPPERTGNVIRAMSLVPDEVRTLGDLSAAHYLPNLMVRQSGVDAGRALNRSQMELVAGRVSALNACYY